MTVATGPWCTKLAAIQPSLPFGARTLRQTMPSAWRSGADHHQRRVLRHHGDDRAVVAGLDRSRAPEPPVPRTTTICWSRRPAGPTLALAPAAGAAAWRRGSGVASATGVAGGAPAGRVGRIRAGGGTRAGAAACGRGWLVGPGGRAAGDGRRHQRRRARTMTVIGLVAGGRVSGVAAGVGLPAAPRPDRAQYGAITNSPSARLAWATAALRIEPVRAVSSESSRPMQRESRRPQAAAARGRPARSGRRAG